jgi:hypothetical protein
MNIPRVKTEGYVPPARTKPESVKSSTSRSTGDVFKPEQNEKLRTILHAEPDARPEAVERARALIVDPGYPSPEVLEKVAQGILQQVVGPIR